MKLSIAALFAVTASACTVPPGWQAAPEAGVAAEPGSGASGGAAATASGGPTGGFDLVYQVPAGWSEQRTDQLITLNLTEQVQPGTDMYGVRAYTLLILPSQPYRGTLADTFHALWAEQILPVFAPTFTPAPMRRRLPSGLICAMDGALMDGTSGGFAEGALYVVAAADRVVPIIGIYRELDDRGEATMRQFFEGLSVGGAAAPEGSLFAVEDLVGTWNTHSLSLANYVDARGNYAGDASLSTGQEYTLRADGTYHTYFAAIRSSGPAFRESQDGSWQLDDDTLVLSSDDGSVRRIRIFGLGAAPGGARAMFLPASYDGDAVAEFTRPRRPLSGDWFGKVD